MPSTHPPEPQPRSSRRRRRLALVALGAALTGVFTATVTRAGAQAPPPSPKAQYDAADGAVRTAQARVDELYVTRRGLEAEGTRLTVEQRAVAERLEEARSEAHQFVVASYISGTGPAVEESVIYQESTTDVAYKSYFVKDRAQRVRDAVERQRSAFTEVDARIADFAIRRSDNNTALERATADLDRANQDLRAADARVREAEAAARAATTTTRGPSVTSPPAAPPPSGSRLNARSSGWDKLRNCESTNNYRARNGIYQGAYQFDQRTWNSVGGTGAPIDASPAEQDYRAQILFNQRGSQPWPVCGKPLNGDPYARQEAVPPG